MDADFLHELLHDLKGRLSRLRMLGELIERRVDGLHLEAHVLLRYMAIRRPPPRVSSMLCAAMRGLGDGHSGQPGSILTLALQFGGDPAAGPAYGERRQRRIAEVHGGEITAIPRARGTEFRFKSCSPPILRRRRAISLGFGCAAQSYDGRIFFGLTSDTDAVPDAVRLRDFIRVSFAELCRAAGVMKTAAPRRPQTAPVAPAA